MRQDATRFTAATLDDQLMQLVSLQSSSGSLENVETLAQLLNATVDDIRRGKIPCLLWQSAQWTNYRLTAGCNGGYNEPIWTTVVALAFLSVALPQLRSSWTLIANKAHKWLRSLSLADESQAHQQAETFVKVKLNIR